MIIIILREKITGEGTYLLLINNGFELKFFIFISSKMICSSHILLLKYKNMESKHK